MKTKRQKQKEALERRQLNLADYLKGELPHGCKRTDFTRKNDVCVRDIKNLKKKLA